MANNNAPHRSRLTAHAFGMIGLLIIEYLLGISTNVFVQFPEGKYGKQLWAFAGQQLPITLHIIIGFLLLLGTLALFIRAIITKSTSWIRTGSIALVAVIAAIVTGSLFIPTQSAGYSFIMALSFIIALLAYFWGIYRNKRI